MFGYFIFVYAEVLTELYRLSLGELFKEVRDHEKGEEEKKKGDSREKRKS